jgi:hypothetical protein
MQQLGFEQCFYRGVRLGLVVWSLSENTICTQNTQGQECEEESMVKCFAYGSLCAPGAP